MSATTTEEYSVRIQRDIETGRILRETWRADGCIHRIGGPAIREFDPDTGHLTSESYVADNHLHREAAPALIHLDPTTGTAIHEIWYAKGQIHRDGDLPAEVTRDPLSGQLTSEEYFVVDEEHREGGPAKLVYDLDAERICLEEWKRHGVLHRLGDLPAVIERAPDGGIVVREEYWRDGLLHRASGPARINRHSETGSVLSVEYHLDGEQFEPSQGTMSPQLD